MNPTLTLTTPRSFSISEVFVAGFATIALVIALQLPALPKVAHEMYVPTSTTLNQEITSAVVTHAVSIADLFFGEEAESTDAQSMISHQMSYVSSRDAYLASLNVIQEYAGAITAEANEQGVPADVAIGVAFLENGGSVTAKSPAGALGVYQLMPYTARNLGLTVTKKVDDRLDPEKSIHAGITYLKMNYDRFGDWGLATWAYHAGEGNVTKALKIYAKAHDGLTLKGISDFDQIHDYVLSHGVTIHKLLSDASVQKFTDKLHDDSSGYPYKVIATATLFREANTVVVR
jgi:hypothetical protein